MSIFLSLSNWRIFRKKDVGFFDLLQIPEFFRDLKLSNIFPVFVYSSRWLRAIWQILGALRNLTEQLLFSARNLS